MLFQSSTFGELSLCAWNVIATSVPRIKTSNFGKGDGNQEAESGEANLPACSRSLVKKDSGRNISWMHLLGFRATEMRRANGGAD